MTTIAGTYIIARNWRVLPVKRLGHPDVYEVGFAKAHPGLYTDEENEAFMAISYTIGRMMLFPRNRIEGKWTLNQARGCLRKISDRFDLTLECIRQHYESQTEIRGQDSTY